MLDSRAVPVINSKNWAIISTDVVVGTPPPLPTVAAAPVVVAVVAV